ncbi:hypothetical protein POTOM_030820 [Populus tomentosa]|uniref:Vesicle-associated membrane protein 727 n=1 Tax=Populus tomentosa TaxID=118781 RepID=A0A8X7Z6D4_POPTO|nr:hypothetical protein POTOM_030820 [Populus tomentosa]
MSSQRGLIYSFVAKGNVVLAEHTSYSGNFSTVAVQCLQKLPSNSSKYTYSCDGHTFNFLIDNGFVFLAVADESAGRGLPFVFLERVKDDFKQRYSASIKNEAHPLADDDDDDDLFEDRFSVAYNLDREFGPRLKEHMQYCLNHPEEISKLSKLKAQITEVKGIMMDNIEKNVKNKVKLSGSHLNITPLNPLHRNVFSQPDMQHRSWAYLAGIDNCSCYYHVIDITLLQVEWFGVGQVLDRGERIELLVDKTENLQFQADSFQRQGRQLRRKMWLQNLQMKLMVGGVVLVAILILWFVACGGFKC